jgi:hypothetical protein
LLAFAAPSLAEEPALPQVSFAEYLIAPLRIHLLSSETQPELHTTLQETDIRRVLGKMNRVWSQAGIGFIIERIVHEPAAAVAAEDEAPSGTPAWLRSHIPAGSRGERVFDLYYIKQFAANGIFLGDVIFVKDTAKLRTVEGGIDEPLPRVSSHELGHALGLPHRQDTFNLMASGTTGTLLNAAEVEKARGRALASGRFLRAPEVVTKARSLRDAGQAREAREIDETLAALPIEAEELTSLREALKPQPAGAPSDKSAP